ncbi:hypothetical protein [Algimonas ampicilliniresistens]|nr:hypothetical protein [Algimonas ampicilliniresistens]
MNTVIDPMRAFMTGSQIGGQIHDRRQAREAARLEKQRQIELAQILSGSTANDPARSKVIASQFGFDNSQGGSALSALGAPDAQGVTTMPSRKSGDNPLAAMGAPSSQPFDRGNLEAARNKALEWGEVKTAQQFHQAISQLDAADKAKAKEVTEKWTRTVAAVAAQPIEQQPALIRHYAPQFNIPPEQIEEYASNPYLLKPLMAQNDEMMKAFAENARDFTLSDGQERFTGSGEMVAQNAPDPMSLSPGSVMVDPTNGNRIAEGNTPAALDPRVLGQKDRGLDLEAQRVEQARQAASAGPKRSLNAVPLQGPDGFSLGQVTSDGQLIPVQSPDGYAPMDPFARKYDEARGGAMGRGSADAASGLAAMERKIGAFRDKSRFLKDTISRAIEQSSGGNTGPIMGRNPFATNLSATLETIKGNLGFDGLQEMRDNSPTGGALGNVSDREIKTLQSLYGSLERSQSQQQLDANLQRLYQHLDGQEARLRQAYEQDAQRAQGGSGPLSYLDNGGGNQSGASDYMQSQGWNNDLERELASLEAELGGAR